MVYVPSPMMPKKPSVTDVGKINNGISPSALNKKAQADLEAELRRRIEAKKTELRNQIGLLESQKRILVQEKEGLEDMMEYIDKAHNEIIEAKDDIRKSEEKFLSAHNGGNSKEGEILIETAYNQTQTPISLLSTAKAKGIKRKTELITLIDEKQTKIDELQAELDSL